jgi:hypothetical protein
MATVLEEYTTEEQRSVVCFLRAKGLSANYNHKEIFPVYGGKCFSLKAVHNRVEKFSQGRSKVADDARPSAEVAETAEERLLCCRFRRTGKAMGHVFQSRWRVCREINFIQVRMSMFYVSYPFLTYLLTLPPIFIHTQQYTHM